METTVKVSLKNVDTVKAALDKAENKLTELRKAIDELEKIELEVQAD